MTDIIAYKQDNTFMGISCERSVEMELHNYFSFFVPNYKFHPKYKENRWDGMIRLYNLKTKTLYVGLIEKLKEFASASNYKIQLDDSLLIKPICNFQSISDVMKGTDYYYDKKIIAPREYQIEAAFHALFKQRSLLECPTASGKSLIIYSILRFLQPLIKPKIALIVPTVNLCEQMYSDFENYSYNDNWKVEENCHLIYSGKEKTTEKQVIISTWQSMAKMDAKFFKQFRVVFGDEAHLYTANSLKKIMESLVNCDYRIGLTGTLDGAKTHRYVLEGLFGQVKEVVSTKQLMDDGYISKLTVKNVVLKYSDNTRRFVSKLKYQDEIKFITGCKERNNVIFNIAEVQKGNVLVLFNFVGAHGKVLFEDFLKRSKKNVYFLSGQTSKVKEREEVRKKVEKEKSCIVIASVGIFSLGVNIKNIQSLVLAHPFKGEIRNLQSIGRALRLDDKTNEAVVYDIVDDMKWKSKINHTLRHWLIRLEIYKKKQFDFKIYNKNIKV